MGVGIIDEVTPLFIDMHICTEHLHCTHEEFLNLSRIEKSKQRNYLFVKSLRQQKKIKDSEDKRAEEENKQKLLTEAPKTR